jgi:hypothetical protein
LPRHPVSGQFEPNPGRSLHFWGCAAMNPAYVCLIHGGEQALISLPVMCGETLDIWRRSAPRFLAPLVIFFPSGIRTEDGHGLSAAVVIVSPLAGL